jgi:hypothetical protein
MRLGMKTRREIFEAHYRRYQQAGKNEKGKILDESAETTGLNRNHLAYVPASYGKKRRSKDGRQAIKREGRPVRGKRGAGEAGGGHQGLPAFSPDRGSL